MRPGRQVELVGVPGKEVPPLVEEEVAHGGVGQVVQEGYEEAHRQDELPGSRAGDQEQGKESDEGRRLAGVAD